ncbi:YcxB family protein [Streptomyces sp. ISL-12]|uniref:YcxB family protein n=1 Tax=Streptomyces sp. ISL-12 TaxID=2819177 RepID=UPI001BE534D6|nr:YcxB family protein [Streptomyces sp. ISL-12]MBT2413224.1 YcxB family protein [Streptomyces sp. ISL-12]
MDMDMDMGRETGADAVELAYRPEFGDFTAALRARRRIRKGARLQRVLLAVAAVCAVVGIAVSAATGEFDLFPVIWIVLVVVLVLLLPWLQARQFLALAARFGDHRATVTESGLTVTNDATSTTVTWAAQPRYRETPELFVLFSDDRNISCFTVLPKRGLGDGADADRLRAVLDRHLARV